jgi:ATP-binding cassette subfamily B (MDR/TAP) protein 1
MDGTTVTQAEFQGEINKLALYIVYLFIAKFVLSYVSMVRASLTPL